MDESQLISLAKAEKAAAEGTHKLASVLEVTQEQGVVSRIGELQLENQPRLQRGGQPDRRLHTDVESPRTARVSTAKTQRMEG